MKNIEITYIKDFLDNGYTIVYEDAYTMGNVIDIEEEYAYLIDFTTEEEFSIDLTTVHYRTFNFYK